jgi:hypothetical protein
MKTIKQLRAFFLGMREFRLSVTQGYEDYALLEAYDRGRDFAHWLTFRRYDQ